GVGVHESRVWLLAARRQGRGHLREEDRAQALSASPDRSRGRPSAAPSSFFGPTARTPPHSGGSSASLSRRWSALKSALSAVRTSSRSACSLEVGSTPAARIFSHAGPTSAGRRDDVASRAICTW